MVEILSHLFNTEFLRYPIQQVCIQEDEVEAEAEAEAEAVEAEAVTMDNQPIARSRKSNSMKCS